MISFSFWYLDFFRNFIHRTIINVQFPKAGPQKRTKRELLDFQPYKISRYCNNHSSALAEYTILNQHMVYTIFFESCRLLKDMESIPLDG